MTTVSNPKVYILLPVHNRRSVTERFIRYLLVQTHTNWHLVLIDDGSSDGTSDMARALVPSLTILHGNGKWWWAGSLHQGYYELRKIGVKSNDVVLIINDDTEFEEGFIEAGAKSLRPRSLLLAQLRDRHTGSFLEAGVNWNWLTLTCRGVAEEYAINCFSTRGLFLHFGTMVEIGGFHPILLPHYFSDYEYTLRARRLGFGLITSPDVWLCSYEELTGVRILKGGTRMDILRAIFSVKTIDNPIYWISFLLLSCPLRYLPANIVRVFRYTRLRIREARQAYAASQPDK